MSLFLSRLQKRRAPDLQAVTALLEPADAGARMDADHRLLWTLFADDPDVPRDFLWRAEGDGYLLLSQRAPQPSPFFETPETRTYAPDLRAGDVLAFTLRVNATRAVPVAGRRGKRVDIVMHALHDVSKNHRADQRMDKAQDAASEWIVQQGAQFGFALLQAVVDDYTVHAVPGIARKGRPHFGVIDVMGRLEVTDPDAFVAKVAQGFGRAKAFGCGLMLLRRL